MTRRSQGRRLIPLLGLAFALLTLFAVSSATAATKSGVALTLPSLGVDPGTSDGGAYNLDVGFAGADDPGSGFVKGRKIGHCIEDRTTVAATGNATLRTGGQNSDLALQPGSLAAATGGRDRLQWLLLSSARSRVATTGSQRDFEAAAHQLAVWLLTTPPSEPAATATDLSALIRANALLAESATNAAAAAAKPALTIQGTEVCGQTTRTVRLTGAPLTDVTLTIAQGQATLTGGSVSSTGQSTTITLGANGTADVGVTSSGVGTVRIVGTFQDQTLVQVDAGPTQDFGYLQPRTVTAEVVLNFTTCQSPTTSTAKIGVVSGISSARLAVSKSGPGRTIARGSMVYRIRVRNTSAVAANDVRISDILPAGTRIVSRPSGSRVVNGRLTWRIGTLGPRASRGFRLVLRMDGSIRGPSVCNNVVVGAGNAPTVRSRVCTIVVAGAISIPKVTG